MLELELAKEVDAVGEAVRHQQNEAMEVQDRRGNRVVNRLVVVHLHIAGDRSGL